jgi:hypothetical protein
MLKTTRKSQMESNESLSIVKVWTTQWVYCNRQELLYSFRAPELIPTPSGVVLLMCICVFVL